MLDSNFWQNKTYSKNILKEKKIFEDLIDSYESSQTKIEDLDELYKLGSDENNREIQNEVLKNLKDLRSLVKKNEIKCFLSNEADFLN